jgi:hypothetical protein
MPASHGLAIALIACQEEFPQQFHEIISLMRINSQFCEKRQGY